MNLRDIVISFTRISNGYRLMTRESGNLIWRKNRLPVALVQGKS
ncbi:hypothetical protein D777_00133 [Marinobacter nitratireducens]|uniref:Uncharacterized protein n=1 Tax=Marinobacter nitratireducens TaxID=1137280 RepID=A0A072NJ25_9GAMM|nr:hypothetical protein D777_00133 [Marinobacter nitratireducens]